MVKTSTMYTCQTGWLGEASSWGECRKKWDQQAWIIKERERGERGETQYWRTWGQDYMCLPDKSWKWHGHGGKFTIREQNKHSIPHPSPFPRLCAIQLSPSPSSHSSLCWQLLLWLSASTTSSLLGVRGGGDEGAMRSIEETTPFTDRQGGYSTTWLHWPKLSEREREIFFSILDFIRHTPPVFLVLEHRYTGTVPSSSRLDLVKGSILTRRYQEPTSYCQLLTLFFFFLRRQ